MNFLRAAFLTGSFIFTIIGFSQANATSNAATETLDKLCIEINTCITTRVGERTQSFCNHASSATLTDELRKILAEENLSFAIGHLTCRDPNSVPLGNMDHSIIVRQNEILQRVLSSDQGWEAVKSEF